MRSNTGNYLKLLEIEVNDIHEDVELQVKNCQTRWENREITEHIYGENMAVFRNQLHGIELFQRLLRNTDGSQYKDIEEIITSLRESFQVELSHTGLYPCFGGSIERKLRKIQRSLDIMDESINAE